VSSEQKISEQRYAETAAFVGIERHLYEPYYLWQNVGAIAIALAQGETVSRDYLPWEGEDMLQTRVYRPDDFERFIATADSETRADIAFLTDKMQQHTSWKETLPLYGAGNSNISM